MSNPRGNPGNRGGGRKSAYEEKANADYLANFFFKEHTKEEIEAMLKGDKRSIFKQMIIKALGGNEKYTIAIFSKLFPETKKLEHGGDIRHQIIGMRIINESLNADTPPGPGIQDKEQQAGESR